MSASQPERPGGTAAAGLGLRRLSELTAGTDGSNALRLTWPVSQPQRPSSASSTAPLTLVPPELPPGAGPDVVAPTSAVRPRTGRPAQPATAHLRSARPPQAVDALLQEQARHLAQALVEILAGDRTLTQLVRWTTAEVYEQLHHRVHTLASCPRPTAADTSAGVDGGPVRRRRPRPRVASVHVSMPTEGVAEVSARIDNGVRSTAVALRLEQRAAGRRTPLEGTQLRVADSRWMCTAVTWV